MQTFRLAPMQAWLRACTAFLLVVPAILGGAASIAPPPERWILAAATAFVLLTYASVWLVWRPTRFEVDADALRIVWPLRVRSIPRADVAGAVRLSGREFRRRHGWGVRIGAGGFGGGFGLLRTRDVTYSMWISRTDDLVVVTVRDARPLLVTPESPDRFVAALR